MDEIDEDDVQASTTGIYDTRLIVFCEQLTK